MNNHTNEEEKDNEEEFILINVGDRAAGMRDTRFRKININLLADNVQIFMGQIESMMEKTPEDVGKFKLTEFTVTAEISATGGLSLLGTGGELSGGGGLTFKFERK